MDKKIDRKILKNFNKTRSHKHFLCNAPFVSMSIDSTGFVSPCCYIHSQTDFFISNSDRYPGKKLIDIWQGNNFERYRTSMLKDKFPSECAICRDEIVVGNYDSVKLKMFDNYAPQHPYPKIIEITADNVCNLQCVMCSSVHSSLIAKKNAVNMENGLRSSSIVEELDEFIPFLERAVFSGGEPFLSSICKEVMKKILLKNPNCTIAVNTNGTVLTDEIKDLLKMGRFHLNISIDSIHKETYEKIRVGASFDTLMKNVEYFSNYSSRVNDVISIPVCPLVLNYRELPQLVSFCNQHGFNVVFVHVFNAHEVALSSANTDILEDTLQLYQNVSLKEDTLIEKQNAKSFRDFIKDVEAMLVFNKKKARFLQQAKPDEQEFLRANEQIEQKIKEFAVAQKDKNYISKFEDWRQKKNLVFEQLPAYFKCEAVFSRIFNFPESMLFTYFDQLPVNELKNYLITFADEIIRKEAG